MLDFMLVCLNLSMLTGVRQNSRAYLGAQSITCMSDSPSSPTNQVLGHLLLCLLVPCTRPDLPSQHSPQEPWCHILLPLTYLLDKRDIWFSVGKKIESIKATPLPFLQLVTQKRPTVHGDPGLKYQNRDYNWSWGVDKNCLCQVGVKTREKGRMTSQSLARNFNLQLRMDLVQYPTSFARTPLYQCVLLGIHLHLDPKNDVLFHDSQRNNGSLMPHSLMNRWLYRSSLGGWVDSIRNAPLSFFPLFLHCHGVRVSPPSILQGGPGVSHQGCMCACTDILWTKIFQQNYKSQGCFLNVTDRQDGKVLHNHETQCPNQMINNVSVGFISPFRRKRITPFPRTLIKIACTFLKLLMRFQSGHHVAESSQQGANRDREGERGARRCSPGGSDQPHKYLL